MFVSVAIIADLNKTVVMKRACNTDRGHNIRRNINHNFIMKNNVWEEGLRDESKEADDLCRRLRPQGFQILLKQRPMFQVN